MLSSGTWVDISTAPRDGTSLLLWCPKSNNEAALRQDAHATVGSWTKGRFGPGWYLSQPGCDCSDPTVWPAPTHWASLPASPRSQSAINSQQSLEEAVSAGLLSPLLSATDGPL
jgi:hypothetical protein